MRKILENKCNPTHRNARATCNDTCKELGTRSAMTATSTRCQRSLAIGIAHLSTQVKPVYSVDGHFAVWSSDAPHALRLKEEPPKRPALRRCWSSTPRTATSARRAQANTQYNVGLLAFGKSTAMLNPIEIRVIARHFYVPPGPEKHYPCRITLNYTAFSNLHNYFPKF